MNLCNGHGTCNEVTGQCECDAGYKFADCSKKVLDLKDDGGALTIDMHGPGWFTMAYSGDKPTKTSINPDVAADVYIIKDSAADPNDFVYDMKFMGVTGNMTFNSDDLGMTSSKGYSIAVYVNAVNETANLLLDASLGIFLSVGASTVGLVSGVVASIITLTV